MLHLKIKVDYFDLFQSPVILKIIIEEFHTGKCIPGFAGIYAYCRYFIDRKW